MHLVAAAARVQLQIQIQIHPYILLILILILPLPLLPTRISVPATNSNLDTRVVRKSIETILLDIRITRRSDPYNFMLCYVYKSTLYLYLLI